MRCQHVHAVEIVGEIHKFRKSEMHHQDARNSRDKCDHKYFSDEHLVDITFLQSDSPEGSDFLYSGKERGSEHKVHLYK